MDLQLHLKSEHKPKDIKQDSGDIALLVSFSNSL